MPRIDVWMPVRDAEAGVGAALRSIVRQSFRDWRLLVVDDGSRDGTRREIDRVRDPRIRVLERPAGGIVAALGTAREASDAPWIARMDGDDLAHRDRLALQVQLDADVVATRVRCGGGAGMRRYVAWQNTLVTHEEIVGGLFIESPLAHPSVLLRREAFERAGGYREGAWAEDYDLWLRLWRAGARFAKVPRRLLDWRDGPARLTRTHPMYGPRALRAAKLEYIAGHPVLAKGPPTLWGAGQEGRAWMAGLKSRGVEVAQVLDIDPRKIGRTLHGARIRRVEDGLRALPGGVIVAVSARDARGIIRPQLLDRGLVEGRDFLFVA